MITIPPHRYRKCGFCIWVAVVFLVLAGSGERLWGQFSFVPASPQWTPNEILSWDPATDANAPYNQSKVPLASRIDVPTAAENAALNALWNVNSHARPGEGKIQAVTTFNTIPVGATHGWRTTRLYSPSMWQYTDNLVFWGSSDRDTKTILAPTAHMIEAAHRNGVRIYGKIFFGWNASPDNVTLQKIRDLLQKTGSTFPVADKLVDAAVYYGFDGYFINQENYQTTATDAQNMRDFIAHFRQRAASVGASHLRIVWYDAMAENGSRSFQNALTTSNDGYMKSGSTLRAHEMFVNFWWYRDSTKLTDSRTYALSVGIDPYDVYAGIWTENNRAYGKTPDENGGGNLDITWDYLFPEGQPHNHSVALFGSETPFFKGSSSPDAIVAQEHIYYSGPNNDPSNTPTPGSSSIPNWPGMAHYIPASSSVTTLPFVTNFNTGQGNLYKISGTSRMTGPWTNASLQDILPTWRWIVQTAGTKTLTPAFDFTESYYGGSSLKVTASSLAANVPQELKLYQTSLLVASNTNLRLIYKPGAVNAAQIEVGYAFEDAPGVMVYSGPATASSTGWTTADYSLAAHAGRRIVAMTLRFSSPSAISNYAANIGRIQISNGSAAVPSAPSMLTVEGTNANPESAYSTQLRLKWTASASPVRYYNVYYRKDLTAATDNQIVWLGATANNCFFAQDIRRTDTESDGYIQVEAVGPDYGVSSRLSTATPTLTFAPLPDLSNKLSGTVIGTDGAFGGGSNTKDKVYDGLLNTFFDAIEADGAWAGLDLGSGNAKRVVAIRYSPRNNWMSRMVKGKFQGSNDLSTWTDLYTVLSTPAKDEYATVNVTDTTAFRYLRYLSPNGGYCNVSEVEFYGPPTLPPAPANLSAVSLNGAVTISWDGLGFSTNYAVKRSTVNGGAYTVVASNLSAPSYQDSGLENGTVYYYLVSAINSVGEGPDSAPLVVSHSNVNQLTGTIIGTAGAWNGGMVNTKEKVFDGLLNTFFDSPNANGDWAGIDMGSGNEKVVNRIRYSPRNSSNNWMGRMVGGQFQGANAADFSDAVTLFTVSATPTFNAYTTVMINNSTPFRYLRYLSPNGGYCNVSEVEFYTSLSLPPAPGGTVGTLKDGTTNLSWNTVPTAVGYRVKRATNSGGPYTVLTPNVTSGTFQDNGLSPAATYYYVVSAVNESGEGPNSSQVVAEDGFSQWLAGNGYAPGGANTGFNQDANGDGISNAVEYAVPGGLVVIRDPSTTTITAIVRQDPGVTVGLWASVDLVAWSTVPLGMAPDQTGVPAGFVRMQAQESVGAQKFYRLQMTR